MHLLGLLLVASAVTTSWSLQGAQDSLAESIGEFALNSLKVIVSDGGATGNVIVSPYSIYSALGVVQQGAQGNTERELTALLRQNPQNNRDCLAALIYSHRNVTSPVTIEAALQLFARPDLHLDASFQEIARNYFLADVERINFGTPEPAAKLINEWVSWRTRGTIPSIVYPEDITADTVLILVNALWFSAPWETTFSPRATAPLDFYPPGEAAYKTPTMYMELLAPAGVIPSLGAKWISIPLKENDFAVLLILPDSNSTKALDDVLKSLQPQLLKQLIQADRNDTKSVLLWLPKFNFQSEFTLVPVLRKLGVQAMFDPETADLTRLATAQGQRIWVSGVLHKATMAVDEEGVIASAATAISFQVKSGISEFDVETMEFKADHPFLVFLVDRKNGIPLFAGRVVRP